MTHLVVPTLSAIGRMLRDEWPDRGFGPSREFDLAVQRLLESGRDWRALHPQQLQDNRYADRAATDH